MKWVMLLHLLKVVDSHGDSITFVRILDLLRLDAIQRHERDSTTLLFVHDIQDLSRRVVIVDYNLEQAACREQKCQKQQSKFSGGRTSCLLSLPLQSCSDHRKRRARIADRNSLRD